MLNRGFIDEEHIKRFAAGRLRVRRGGTDEKICGAKTRSGALCRSAPLKGHWRCLRHAGPKAARELRQRQLRALAMGTLSAAAFAKLEARRERNRLQRMWRKDPWIEGETIALGPCEAAFRAAAGWQALSGLAPADIDWLRWRYRRYQIDLKDDDGWLRALWHQLPERRARSDAMTRTNVLPETCTNAAVHDHKAEAALDLADEAMWRMVRESAPHLNWLFAPPITERERRWALLTLIRARQGDDPRAWADWIEFLRLHR